MAMARKPNVYVTKKLGHDFSDAEQYGNLHVVFPPDLSPFRLRIASEITDQFLEENPPQEGDFILTSGPATLNMVLSDALLERIGQLEILVFHARDRIYIQRELVSAKRRAAIKFDQ